MPTCPNCGEIVMNGDPYCPNCGTIFRKSYDEGLVDEFKNFHFYAYDAYNMKNYDFAMTNLSIIFSKYKHMSNSQKSQVIHMLKRLWVVDLCCITANNHAKYYSTAMEIIEKMDFSIMICEDCDCIYPATDKFCIRCGNPLEYFDGYDF